MDTYHPTHGIVINTIGSCSYGSSASGGSSKWIAMPMKCIYVETYVSIETYTLPTFRVLRLTCNWVSS